MICEKCKKEKGIDFTRSKRICRECYNEDARERRKADKLKEKPEFIICKKCGEKTSDFRINRRTCLNCERAGGRNYRQTTDTAKVWVENNRERMSELQREWHDSNREHIYENRKALIQSSEKHKKGFAHGASISRLINKTSASSKNVNCDSQRLRHWLSYQFDDQMTFDNYGKYWVVDHVIPIHKFLTDECTETVVLNWLNISPVPKKKNLIKNKSIDPEQCKLHRKRVKLYLATHKIEEKTYEEYKTAIKSFAKHLVAGTSLESFDTTSSLKEEEGTRLVAEPKGKKSKELGDPQART